MEEEKKKAMAALLGFILATLEIVFDKKRLLDGRGQFGGNVFKNLVGYISSQ